MPMWFPARLLDEVIRPTDVVSGSTLGSWLSIICVCIALIPGPNSFGIRAGPFVGKPYNWSMLILVFVKTI